MHTEKPVALRYDEARELVELAQRTGRRLSCSPATLLGEAQQTAWKLVRDGALGHVRVVYAEANWGRIESWHPTPQSLYAVGPLVDVGVYPLTILTAMFGPVRRVVAYGATLEPDRTTLAGEPFLLAAPDFIVSLLELDGGVIVRLTTTFWVRHGRQRGIEFHGADGRSLHLASFLEFDSALEMSSDAGETYADGVSRRRAVSGYRLGSSDRGPRGGDRRGAPAPRERRAGCTRRRDRGGDRTIASRERGRRRALRLRAAATDGVGVLGAAGRRGAHERSLELVHARLVLDVLRIGGVEVRETRSLPDHIRRHPWT